MKKNMFWKAGCCLSAMLLSVAMISCNGNNPDDPNVEPNPSGNNDLVLSVSSVNVGQGEDAKVEITSGNGGYIVISADETVATATVAGTTVTIHGVKGGSTTISVKDAAKKAKPIAVKVSASGTNNINTSVMYTIEATSDEWSQQGDAWGNIWANYKGPKTYDPSPICTKRDYVGHANNWLKYDNDDIKELFEAIDDDNVFVCAGLGYEGTLDFGHAAIVLLLTDEDDPAHPGMKKVTVLSTNAAAYVAWNGYTSTPGTAWYDPSDGSFTIKNCKGHLGWENGAKPFEFCADRKYTPQN